jgi:hypothetical protein
VTPSTFRVPCASCVPEGGTPGVAASPGPPPLGGFEASEVAIDPSLASPPSPAAGPGAFALVVEPPPQPTK